MATSKLGFMVLPCLNEGQVFGPGSGTAMPLCQTLASLLVLTDAGWVWPPFQASELGSPRKRWCLLHQDNKREAWGWGPKTKAWARSSEPRGGASEPQAARALPVLGSPTCWPCTPEPACSSAWMASPVGPAALRGSGCPQWPRGWEQGCQLPSYSWHPRRLF